MTVKIGSGKPKGNTKRDALMGIMHEIYGQAREVEEEHGIHAAADDLRPRIEYFHDAVRTLSENPRAAEEKTGRLTVEHLAWDLSWLRHIQEKPTVRMPSTTEAEQYRATSKGKDMVLAGKTKIRDFNMPPPTVRAELSTLYKNYTVMFAALFAETVDMNYQTLRSDMDTEVEDLAQAEQMIRLIDQGEAQEENLEQMLDYLADEKLKAMIMAMLNERAKAKKRQLAIQAVYQIRELMAGIDGEIANLEKSHMNYLSGQMVLYQDSKDMVKKLAAQGMNLAGQYLDQAVQAAAQGAGRGF